MVYGYLRVSTDKQDCENQKLGVNAKAKELGVAIDKWIEDNGVSGTKEPEKRKLGWLLKKVKKGDTIIISELSRFGRSMYMVMRILENLSRSEVLVYSHKDNFKLDSTIESKVIAFAFSIAAEIERDMISRRTREALQRKRSEGTVLGRPLGSISKKKKLSDREAEIVAYLSKGLSFSSIARLMNVHRLTIATMVKDCGLTKYRKNYLAYSEASEARAAAAKMRLKNSGKQLETQLANDEIIRLYGDCLFSIPQLAKKMDMTALQCRSMIEKRGLWERIKEANQQQREKVKSNRQRASENEANKLINN
jgi:DNA invertase Pin-like site-specific DNA recombinase